MLAQFICVEHNLVRLLEEKLAADWIGNAVESKRRLKRAGVIAAAADCDVPPTPSPTGSKPWADCLCGWLSRFTQRGVKFIRWLCAGPTAFARPVE